MTDAPRPQAPPDQRPARRTGPRWMLAIKLFWAVAIIVLAFIGYEFFTGQPYGFPRSWWQDNPHMLVQPHLRTFDAQMPQAPAGTVPMERPPRAPTSREAAGLANPLLRGGRAAPQQIAWGRTYYQYYCAFCHGERGDGNGPVGESYTPRPAGLRSQRIAGMSDGQLLRAMLTGPGHQVIISSGVPTSAPVLENVIPPDYWWYLVLYVRQLGA